MSISSVAAVRGDIASMRTRGAAHIAQQAVSALADAAAETTATSMDGFREELLGAARELASARPTAVSLRNGLNAVLAAALDAADVHAARTACLEAAQGFSARVDAARDAIATLGQTRIETGDRILTHCHSTAAVGILRAAQVAGKRISVIATETRPFGQGLITTQQLREAKIPATLIVDSAVYHVLKTQSVARVIVGADTVAADGSLYNKIGTSQVALAAHVLGIPVHVAAETYKFSPYTLEGAEVEIEEREAKEVATAEELAEGVEVFNPVFDRTAPELVTEFVTDEGLLKPADVEAFIRREYGGQKLWI